MSNVPLAGTSCILGRNFQGIEEVPMGRRKPLTKEERERIYRAKPEGKILEEAAAKVGCSVSCTRKWWQRGRDEGLKGLRDRPRGPNQRGALSRFDPRVTEAALSLKRRHSRWGPNRVLAELRTDPNLRRLRLPSRSCLALFFREQSGMCGEAEASSAETPSPSSGHRCPRNVARGHPRRHPPGRWDDRLHLQRLGPRRGGDHCQPRLPCPNGEALAQTALDGGAIGSAGGVHRVADPAGWGGDRQRADPGGQSDRPLPSRLTLWLVGLGVRHLPIRPHRPTDQAQVERTRRTLSNFALDEESQANLPALQ